MQPFDFTIFPELETERLILRRIMATDVDDWFAVWNHEAVIWHLIDVEGLPQDTAEILSIIDWADRIFASKSGLRWAVTLKPDRKMIGSVGFHLYEKVHRKAEIGYELHHNHWRRGIMRESLFAILRFGFKRLNLHRVEANVTVGNEASAGLLRSLGFTLEGTWRECIYNRGRFHDLWQFGLLEDEYRQRLSG